MHKRLNFLSNSVLILALFVVASCLPTGRAHAEVKSELHITADGKLTAKNLTVMQKSENGTTFFSRAVWGEVFVRLTVVAAPSGVAAKITKNNGGPATTADVQVGDTINVEGILSPGADTLLINATSIKDLSLNVESKSVSGTIKTLNTALGTFTTTDKNLGAISVVAPYNITKGSRTISSGELVVGDKVLSASGTFDFSTKTFTAQTMEVYQDKSVFVAKNFEGTLKSISGTTLPITTVVTVGKIDYTVYFVASTSVLNNAKKPASLVRFTVGDTVRLYGNIRPINLNEIDANLLRNLNF